MPNPASSSPASFTVGPISPLSQAMTFDLTDQAGVVVSAFFRSSETTSTGNGGALTCNGSTNNQSVPGPGTYTIDFNANSTQLAGINAAIGGTLNATFSTSTGTTISVSSLALHLTFAATINPSVVTDDEDIPTPTFTLGAITISPGVLDNADDIPTPSINTAVAIYLGGPLDEYDDIPLSSFSHANSISPDPVTDDETFSIPSLNTGTGNQTIMPDTLTEGNVDDAISDVVLVPSTVNAASIKFRQCPDVVGAHWRTDVAVTDGDQYAAAVTWLGHSYGVLFSLDTEVYWIATQTPYDWSGATPVDLMVKGRVRGLAKNDAGVLMGLIDGDGTDPTKPGCTPVVSRDLGGSWDSGHAVPVTGNATIVAIGNIFFVVQSRGAGFQHFQSLDCGSTWI